MYTYIKKLPRTSKVLAFAATNTQPTTCTTQRHRSGACSHLWTHNFSSIGSAYKRRKIFAFLILHTHTHTQLAVDGGSCCCHYKFNIVSSESHTHPHSHLLQSIAHGKPFALRQATHLTAPTLGRAAWSNCVLRIAV